MRRLLTMKRDLIKIGIIMTLLSALAVTSYGEESLALQEKSFNENKVSKIEQRNSDINWRYKTVKGVKYKRLYNIATSEWIGDWIKA